MKTHQEQAQELGQRIADLIGSYHDKQVEAGTPILLNDILSALAHCMGGLIAGLPEEATDGVFGQLGEMVRWSINAHRNANAGAPIEVFEEEGTMQ